MRQEILQLILSRAPRRAAWSAARRTSAGAPRRRSARRASRPAAAAVPNDGDCELQHVVGDWSASPTSPTRSPTAGSSAEHDDPFYDRDYNLCILCGRCVRMCQEVRGAAVLAFKYRGPQDADRAGLRRVRTSQAGCEFCGACVSVCPTGALADKVSKWDGKPDGRRPPPARSAASAASCELAHEDGGSRRCSGAPRRRAQRRPALRAWAASACRRRRTIIRARPRARCCAAAPTSAWQAGTRRWREVARGWPRGRPDELLMLVSGDLTNEGLYAAQRLVRAGLGARGVDSTAARRRCRWPASVVAPVRAAVSIRRLVGRPTRGGRRARLALLVLGGRRAGAARRCAGARAWWRSTLASRTLPGRPTAGCAPARRGGARLMRLCTAARRRVGGWRPARARGSAARGLRRPSRWRRRGAAGLRLRGAELVAELESVADARGHERLAAGLTAPIRAACWSSAGWRGAARSAGRRRAREQGRARAWRTGASTWRSSARAVPEGALPRRRGAVRGTRPTVTT